MGDRAGCVLTIYRRIRQELTQSNESLLEAKNVLQQLGAPPWEREVLPLLAAGDGELDAVGDLAYSTGFDAWLREAGARLLWVRRE